jgi:hypothetical protein
MSSTGAAGALQVVLGGIAGSLVTWCLTWYRERRRLIDAAREPQRQAIAGIAAAAYELFMQQVRRSQLRLATTRTTWVLAHRRELPHLTGSFSANPN